MIERPGKIVAIGLNYMDHALEPNMEPPKVPLVFAKFPSSVIDHEEQIRIPRNLTERVDWEVELAVVIGKRAKDVEEKDALTHVAGYCVCNDVSEREFQLEHGGQWVKGKSFDTFAPMGPAIVTTDEIEDPHTLDIELSINGEVLQRSNTRHLIFKLPDLIEHLSSVISLEPGDIISTGTPAGVGLGRTPKRWLKPGEEIVIKIERIGELRNRTVAA